MRPVTKLESVRYIAMLEGLGVEIKNTEGKNWRLLSLNNLIRLAQDLWDERNHQ